MLTLLAIRINLSGTNWWTLNGTLKPQSKNYTAIRWLAHWPLIDGLLHLVQRRGAWAGFGSTSSPRRCTKCNRLSINGQCSNFIYSMWHYNHLCTL